MSQLTVSAFARLSWFGASSGSAALCVTRGDIEGWLPLVFVNTAWKAANPASAAAILLLCLKG